MDLDGLITELQIRGFDQHRIDVALKCLVHVYAVQDYTSLENGGVLAEDILNTYPLDIAHAAADLFLDRHNSLGRDVFRVRWGFDTTAQRLKSQLWENGAERWEEFVSGLDERYLGFFLPESYDAGRVVSFWKTHNDLKWFGVEVPSAGWNILRMIDDISSIGYALDLAFAYRSFDERTISGERTVLHEIAFEVLKKRAVPPPDVARKGIGAWKFFSEYDPNSTDIVRLIKECGVTLDEVETQIGIFYRKGLTTPYREGQYPPYLIMDKMKERYQQEVRSLLAPMEAWLLRKDPSKQAGHPISEVAETTA